jgi:hypothetical protein
MRNKFHGFGTAVGRLQKFGCQFAAVLAVRGRIALIPRMMFLVTAVLTAVGAVVPAAVAIIAPLGMGFATRYKINPLLMALLIINGASTGGFSPIGIFGSIVNGVVTRNALPGNPTLLFLSSFVFNLVLSMIVFVLFGGRELLRRGQEVPGDEPSGGGGVAVSTAVTTLNRHRVLTLAGLVVLAGGALIFSLDVGFTAITVAVLLSMLSPADAKAAVGQIAWPTMLLIGGAVSAFASTTVQHGGVRAGHHVGRVPRSRVAVSRLGQVVDFAGRCS